MSDNQNEEGEDKPASDREEVLTCKFCGDRLQRIAGSFRSVIDGSHSCLNAVGLTTCHHPDAAAYNGGIDYSHSTPLGRTRRLVVESVTTDNDWDDPVGFAKEMEEEFGIDVHLTDQWGYDN